MRGQLYIIGTPIGNLGDMTPRGAAAMKGLDILFCEDTRVSAPLLAMLGVKVSLRALSDDLPDEHVRRAIELVVQGKKVGFISDAGMPGVSDPARRLTRQAWAAGIVPQVIPGVSAVSTLLAVCPFVDGPFKFAGFAGRRGAEKDAFIEMLLKCELPVLFFDGPSRVHKLLDQLCQQLEPERQLLIGRELTKLHEQVLLFTAAEWVAQSSSVPAKGEFTLAVAAAPQVKVALDEAKAQAAIARLQQAGFSTRDAIKAYGAVLDVSGNEVKKLAYKEGN